MVVRGLDGGLRRWRRGAGESVDAFASRLFALRGEDRGPTPPLPQLLAGSRAFVALVDGRRPRAGEAVRNAVPPLPGPGRRRAGEPGAPDGGRFGRGSGTSPGRGRRAVTPAGRAPSVSRPGAMAGPAQAASARSSAAAPGRASQTSLAESPDCPANRQRARSGEASVIRVCPSTTRRCATPFPSANPQAATHRRRPGRRRRTPGPRRTAWARCRARARTAPGRRRGGVLRGHSGHGSLLPVRELNAELPPPVAVRSPDASSKVASR